MILVTGATGNTGRHVIDGLLAAGADVRALVRQPLLAGLPAGVELAVGDITDPEAVRKAAAGAEVAFLLWPSYSAEGAAPVVAALTEQVSRVVYLSALNVDDDQPAEQNGVWGQVEELIVESGADWTFVRPGGFAANTREWAEEIRSGGVVTMPSPKAGRSLIHERDIADVAVLALLDAAHSGKKYVLTGPEVLTQEEQVAAIGAVIGKELRVEEQSAEQAREAMFAAGADPVFVDSGLRYWESLVDTPEPVHSTYRELTGRPGRTYQEWVREHADEFRVLSTEEVAEEFVGAFRSGEFARAGKVQAADVVRVSPSEYEGELVGQLAIMENAVRTLEGHEISRVDILGPLVSPDHFAARFTFHFAGDEPETTKLSLYTVTAGKITREEVFYFTEPVS
ncbi:NAD(P)H-binding protein [Kribbella sp. DT2]|uniref:NmrA family NAD(P)-binding protein n=1 Tax=Kribbella sp. DT2 TaxID=3393427 RepID=UPI003CF145F0